MLLLKTLLNLLRFYLLILVKFRIFNALTNGDSPIFMAISPKIAV